MTSLLEAIHNAETKKTAVGHFNISELAALKGIFAAAQDLNLPVIIGLSEGEREFMGTRRAALMVKSLREEFNWPIFINADHTHSLEKIKEAVEAGFDAVLFDGGKLPLEENIRKTREVVECAKSVNPEILVEGELGYIGSSSAILKEIPRGAAIKPEDLTKPEEAAEFVKETGVDLLAPAVGNFHGMVVGAPKSTLNAGRVGEIRKAAGIPLVLHGGSGTDDENFIKAIEAGASIVHINTELRLAWRKGIEAALKENPEEVAPYKILPKAVEEIKEVVSRRLKLFNRMV